MSENKPGRRVRTPEETALQIKRITERLLKNVSSLEDYFEGPGSLPNLESPQWQYFDEVPRAEWATLRFRDEGTSEDVMLEKHDRGHVSLIERSKGVDLTDHEVRIDVRTTEPYLSNIITFEGKVIDRNELNVQQMRMTASRILWFSIERLREIKETKI